MLQLPALLLAFAGVFLTVSVAQVVDFGDCGHKKQCLPVYCASLEEPFCKMGLSYSRINASWVELEVFAPIDLEQSASSRYLAIGFSADKTMGNDAVTYCVRQSTDESHSVEIGFTSTRKEEGVVKANLSSTKAPTAVIHALDISEGIFSCRFSRQISEKQQSPWDIVIGRTYYPLIATGFMGDYGVDSAPRKHSDSSRWLIEGSVVFSFARPTVQSVAVTDAANTDTPTTDAATTFMTLEKEAERVFLSDFGPVSERPPQFSALPEMEFSTSECGQTKGCLLSPPDCSSVFDCDLALSYRMEDDEWLLIELSTIAHAYTPQYIAVGLSDDQTMGADSVMACVYGEGTSLANEVLLTYNLPQPARLSLPLRNEDLNGTMTIEQLLMPVSMGILDGRLGCQFRRRISSNDSDDDDLERLFPITAERPYYLLLATGPAATDGSGLTGHSLRNQPGLFPLASSQRIDLTSTSSYMKLSVYRDPTKFTQRKCHACFMLVGWMILIPLAVSIAHYGKDLSSHYPRLWFNVHVFLNMSALVVIAVSLVTIAVASDWNWLGFGTSAMVPASTKTHALIGIISCALAATQPFGAMFRCKLGSPRRMIFTWIHRTVGMVAFVGSAVTIGFAREFDIGLSHANNGSMALVLLIIYWSGYIIFPIVIDVALVVADRMASRARAQAGVSPVVEMSVRPTLPNASFENGHPSPRARPSDGSVVLVKRKTETEKYVVKLLLLAFAVFIVAITVTLILMIAEFDGGQ